MANRGEIAVRVQRTLKTLGIATVAVYSDSDSTAPHVLMADEARALGGQTAAETYLDMEKIITISRQCGVEAIHPGYGFLSENPRFPRACAEAGIVFIGPTPESMVELGDKIRSKELARRAGVPVVPNSAPCDRVDTIVDRFVGAWGFPLLVKATAGGGGRGMRLVNRLEELAPALESAGREAHAGHVGPGLEGEIARGADRSIVVFESARGPVEVDHGSRPEGVLEVRSEQHWNLGDRHNRPHPPFDRIDQATNGARRGFRRIVMGVMLITDQDGAVGRPPRGCFAC